MITTRCTLDGVIGFLALAVSGVYLALAVGVADFCAAPNAAITDLLGGVGGQLEAAALYYVNCEMTST